MPPAALSTVANADPAQRGHTAVGVTPSYIPVVAASGPMSSNAPVRTVGAGPLAPAARILRVSHHVVDPVESRSPGVRTSGAESSGSAKSTVGIHCRRDARITAMTPYPVMVMTAAVTAPVSIRLIAIQKQAIAVHQWAIYGHSFAREHRRTATMPRTHVHKCIVLRHRLFRSLVGAGGRG
jgi:hypothetical protein